MHIPNLQQTKLRQHGVWGPPSEYAVPFISTDIEHYLPGPPVVTQAPMFWSSDRAPFRI